MSWLNVGVFLQNCPNLPYFVRVTSISLLAMSFSNKLVKSTCSHCFQSICNWWCLGELGFCCKEAEPCITVHGCVCVYTSITWSSKQSINGLRVHNLTKITELHVHSWICLHVNLTMFTLLRKEVQGRRFWLSASLMQNAFKPNTNSVILQRRCQACTHSIHSILWNSSAWRCDVH